MGQGVLSSTSTKQSKHVHSVYCFPFYSLMLALNQTRIDYFSLDVEGMELDILKTIPFDKLDIKVLTVEYKHAQSSAAYRDFMTKKGYYLYDRIIASDKQKHYFSHDYVFVKKKVFKNKLH